MKILFSIYTSVIILVIMTTACSTRQITDTVSGTTAQRLATYSLERFVRDLVDQPEMELPDAQIVQLSVHFFNQHPLLDYAEALLRQELESRYRVKWGSTGELSPVEIDVYFNSIGTDHDSFGLSLPSFGLAGATDGRINVLAIDMFHGVTEGYAQIKNNENNSLLRSNKILSRVRADNISTPIVDFPLNQLD